MLDDLLEGNGLAEMLIERGERRGEHSGQVKMARAVLEASFGPLRDDVLVALNDADEQTLLALATNAATDTPEQMRARLGLGLG